LRGDNTSSFGMVALRGDLLDRVAVSSESAAASLSWITFRREVAVGEEVAVVAAAAAVVVWSFMVELGDAVGLDGEEDNNNKEEDTSADDAGSRSAR
jgi:hypothetical protein